MSNNLPPSDAEEPSTHAMEDLVRGLDDLHDNLRAQVQIFALGEQAVPALVRFVLAPTSRFPDGRVLAAEALGRLKGDAALEGLLGALDPRRFDGLDPVLRSAEEDVQNAVAEQLARMGDRRVVPALVTALRRNRLVGAANALVEFGEIGAIPWMVDALEDAFKRGRLAQAIRRMGRAAIPSLIATLDRRRTHQNAELLPSVERRAEALSLLGSLNAAEAADHIRAALSDPHDKVRTEAALALVAVERGDRVLDAVPVLLAGLSHSDFLQRDRCTDALCRVGPRCVSMIESALREGSVTAGGETTVLSDHARVAARAALDQLKGSVSC